jgi:hypothetical protein
MFRQLKGVVLFAFGAFAVADSFLGIVQKSSGPIRWVYFGLGAYLVVRGLFIIKSSFQKRAPEAKEVEKMSD